METKVTNLLNKVSNEDKNFLKKLWIWFVIFIVIITLFLMLSWGKKEEKEIVNPALKAQELQMKENKLFQEKQNLDNRIIKFYNEEKKPFLQEVQWMIDWISENKIDTSLLQNIK